MGRSEAFLIMSASVSASTWKLGKGTDPDARSVPSCIFSK